MLKEKTNWITLLKLKKVKDSNSLKHRSKQWSIKNEVIEKTITINAIVE